MRSVARRSRQERKKALITDFINPPEEIVLGTYELKI